MQPRPCRDTTRPWLPSGTCITGTPLSVPRLDAMTSNPFNRQKYACHNSRNPPALRRPARAADGTASGGRRTSLVTAGLIMRVQRDGRQRSSVARTPLMALPIEQDPPQLLDVRPDEVEQRLSGLRADVAFRRGDGCLAPPDQVGDDGRIGLDRGWRAAKQWPGGTL